MNYATRCRNQYGVGREQDYVRCMLCFADTYADVRALQKRARDQYVVRRATKALVQLQGAYPNGVPGAEIVKKAGFQDYKNPASHGLWPWLERHGGWPVVVKARAGYLIAERFYPALQQILSVPSPTSVCNKAPCP